MSWMGAKQKKIPNKIVESTYQLSGAQISGSEKDTFDEHFRIRDSWKSESSYLVGGANKVWVERGWL